MLLSSVNFVAKPKAGKGKKAERKAVVEEKTSECEMCRKEVSISSTSLGFPLMSLSHSFLCFIVLKTFYVGMHCNFSPQIQISLTCLEWKTHFVYSIWKCLKMLTSCIWSNLEQSWYMCCFKPMHLACGIWNTLFPSDKL